MNPAISAIPHQLGSHSLPVGFPVSFASPFSLTSAVISTHQVNMDTLVGKVPNLTSGSLSVENQSKIVHLGGRRKGHTCEICGKNFRQKPVLKTHMKIHADTKDHFCPECGRGFTYKANMDVHMRVHSGEKPHECCHCGKRFSQSNSLKYHLSTHTGYKPFICQVCQKTFVTKGNLRDHMITHSSDKPFKCDVCGHNFARKVSLNTHYRSHFSPQSVKCRFCKESFPNNAACLYHNERYCGPLSKDFQQHQAVSNSNSSVQIEDKTDEDFDLLIENGLFDKDQSNSVTSKHFQPKFYTCSTCVKSFKSKSVYLTHKEVCSNTRNHDRYDCPHCHMTFTDLTSLNLHKSLHLTSSQPTKDKNSSTVSSSLKCSVCNSLFFDKDQLLEHYQQHLNFIAKK